MNLTARQRNQIKENGQILLSNDQIKVTYGITNGNAAPHLCNYRYDGYECMRVAVWYKGELKLISNTWKKAEKYISDLID